MALPEHDHMVETLASDRADQSLYVPVLPRRAGSDRLVADAHGPQPARDRSAVNRILVADQIARRLGPREGFGYLLCDPLRRRVSCDIDPD